MKFILGTTFFFLSIFNLIAQSNDYKTIRDRFLNPTCGQVDSSIVFQNHQALLNVNTDLYPINIDLYYSDLGFSFYRIYLISSDISQLKNSIDAYSLSNEKLPKQSYTLWQLSILNFFLGDCEQCKYFLKEYKAVTEANNWDIESIQGFNELCGE